jgi:hypothetical protein
MKKLILIVLGLLLIGSFSFAQTWYPANQKMVAWDAVTTLDDGSPIPAGETVRYQVYILKEGEPETNKISVGSTTESQFLVTLSNEGKWFIGIESERMQGESIISKSSISWSSNTVVCQNGESFGITFFRMPRQPMNLRPL